MSNNVHVTLERSRGVDDLLRSLNKIEKSLDRIASVQMLDRLDKEKERGNKSMGSGERSLNHGRAIDKERADILKKLFGDEIKEE